MVVYARSTGVLCDDGYIQQEEVSDDVLAEVKEIESFPSSFNLNDTTEEISLTSSTHTVSYEVLRLALKPKITKLMKRLSISFVHVDAWFPPFVSQDQSAWAPAEGAAGGEQQKWRLCFADCATANNKIMAEGGLSVPLGADKKFDLLSLGPHSEHSDCTRNTECGTLDQPPNLSLANQISEAGSKQGKSKWNF